MTQVPNLPILAALANEDLLYGVDVSDTSESAAGTSVAIRAAMFGGSPGNVLRFGADRTGATDSSVAIQAAIDSGHAVYVPPGLYRLDSMVVIIDPLIMYCYGGTSVNDGNGGDDDDLPLLANIDIDIQATFYTLGTNHLFQIQTGNVSIQGGSYLLSFVTATSPASPLAPGDQACFHMPFVANGSSAGGNQDRGGWGLWIQGVWCQGSVVHLQDEDQGGIGFWFDSLNYEVANAYWTNLYIDAEVWGLRYGIYAPARNDGFSQWANTGHFHLATSSSKCSMHIESINSCEIWSKHQGRHIFSTVAESLRYKSIYLRGGGHTLHDTKVFDFGKTTSNGRETNQTAYDVVAPSVYSVHEDHTPGNSNNFDAGSRTFWPYIYNAEGIMPRYLSGQLNSGVFIPELHDHLLQWALSATVTIEAYQGLSVSASPGSPPDIEADFLALEYDSASAGIPVSTEITIQNPETLFLYEGISNGLKWDLTQTAIDHNDYVEIHIGGGGANQLARLWFIMAARDGRQIKYIQIVRYTDSSPQSGTVWNEFIEVEAMSENRNKKRLYEFDLDETGQTDMIVRLIGQGNVASPIPQMSMAGMYAIHNWNQRSCPILTLHGGKNVYGHLNMEAGGIGDREVTTAELEDVSHEVNTSAYKRAGFCVYNTTTELAVWARGSGDADTWKDAAGNVAHTPV